MGRSHKSLTDSQGAHRLSEYLFQHRRIKYPQVGNRGFDKTNGTGDISMSTKKRVAAILITTVAISSGTVGVASADSKSKTNRISVAGQAVRGRVDLILQQLLPLSLQREHLLRHRQMQFLQQQTLLRPLQMQCVQQSLITQLA